MDGIENQQDFIERICRAMNERPKGKVMDHGAHPDHRGIPEKVTAFAKITGPCGDTDEMFLRISRGWIKEARFITDGCIFATAACDAAAHLAMGRKIEDCKGIDQQAILDYLEDMPEDHRHCARLASQTLAFALKRYSEEEKKSSKTSLVQQFYTYRAIGTVRTPFKDVEGMPIQPAGARGIAGKVIIDKAYRKGLKDLEAFSHIILLYHLHLCDGFDLQVKPFLDDVLHGIFACRSPKRPNPIGLSLVKLIRVEGAVLHIEDVDIIDGTPLLDIKPYVPLFDHIEDVRTGWLSDRGKNVFTVRSDARFKSSVPK